jgi:hypothetical protein
MKTFGFVEIPEGGISVLQEGALLRIYFDFTEMERSTDASAAASADEGEAEAEETPVRYEAYNVNVRAPFSYAAIVSAVVNNRYTADDVQALQANYIEAKDAESSIADDKREEYLSEWSEFQAWRSRAKELARAVVDMLTVKR